MTTPRSLCFIHPGVSDLPLGEFKYASLTFALEYLPSLDGVILRMAEGIREPRVSYTFRILDPGERFGHGRWHRDGKEEPAEIHRLLTVGGNPTEGLDGFILHGGVLWEYSGDYIHRAVPSLLGGTRLMLRVSQTDLAYRNHWNTPFSKTT